MNAILNYQIEKEIYESSNSIVYRGKKKDHTSGEQQVILKILRKEYPSPEEIARFKREFEMTQSLEDEGIVKAYHFEKYQNSFVMILEDFGGDSIFNYLKMNKMNLKQFLTLAIKITEIVGVVHSKKVIHKDINPSNIIWNPNTNQVKLIDFGISSKLSHETANLGNVNILEGTLNYMSPEQTGRMNRAMDYRTDLYSLGATFYQMLTGQIPFEGQDAMEIVHSHIAKDPIPPHELNKEIPKILSQIILRLMAKTAENRYQSIFGLVYDLKWCLENIGTSQSIGEAYMPHLQIGAHDISDRFEIPQKLYGRTNEVETLMNAFSRIKENTKEIILLSGYSGIGKSSVVQEIYKPIVERKGIFIRGKFDQYKRNIPYASLIQAFQELVRQILTEGKEELSVRKEQILAALGQNSSVIVDVIPEVGFIIGEQPPARILSPEESRNRFNLVFRNFVRVFSSEKNPLVIFLDDLQWADLPSLHLLELIVTDHKIGNLLVIGAYRDNEVNLTHPLLITLEEIKNKKITVNTITLSPLNLYHISQLVADTLNIPQEESTALSALCFEKTQGNPFFLNQFLSRLNQEKLILFDSKQLKWIWDVGEIQKRGITDNVVELMSNKIKTLQDVTQNILRLSACIGNQFDLRTLATVNEKSLSVTATDLWEALKEGLIIPLSETYNLVGNEDNTKLPIDNPDLFESIIPLYRFLHDRVQQASYSLIAEEDRKRVHLNVGRLLLKNAGNDIQEENLFDIVNHLNTGRDLISDEVERLKLIELNLSVSKKAKLSAAYEPAFNYAQNALALFAKDAWINHFDLSLKTHIEAAETAYLSGHFEIMEDILENTKAKKIPLVHQAKIYEIKILAAKAKHAMMPAVLIGLEILKIMGIQLSENPSQEEVGKELGEIMQTLSKYKISELIELPVMSDQEQIAAMRILNSLFSPSYQVAPGLFPLLVFSMLRLSLKYGNTPVSAIAYSCYGLVLCGIVGDIISGYEFGKLALNLIDKLQDEEYKSNVWYNANTFTIHWKEPLRNTVKPLLDAYHMGMMAGEIEFASLAPWLSNVHSFFAGNGLQKILEDTSKYKIAIEQVKQEAAIRYISSFHQTLLNLVNPVEKPWILLSEHYNEEKMLAIHAEVNDATALCIIYFYKLLLSYLMEEYDIALEFSISAEKYLGGVPSTQYVVVFIFYDSLTQIANYPQKKIEEKEKILSRVNANQEKMKTWAEHCPENFLHKYYLVEAEKARVLEEDLQAINFYDKASKLAKQNEFLQEEALANELYAHFWLNRDKEEFAQMLLNKAYHLYAHWGAGTKVAQLEKKYPHFLTKKTKSKKINTLTGETTLSSLDENIQTLDLISVMKASQSISQEIVIEELLKNMMHTIIENAGAQTGFLLQEKKDGWMIEAYGRANQKEVTVLQSIPIQSANTITPQVPLSIIQYVSRTKESVVLEDASRDSKYTSDSYIIQNQPKSVLCTAILHHGKSLGILYLENNLISGVFTSEKLKVLQLLSSQIAISFENATLYANLEEKVRERTIQLEDAHKKILILEKETMEKQLAGGFAHEMRNALVGPRLVIQHMLGQDGSEPFESVSFVNSRKLKEIYMLIKDRVSEETLNAALKSMKTIFENEEQIENSLNMIYKAVSKGLSITQLIMDYSKVGNEMNSKDRIDLNQVLLNLVQEYKEDWGKQQIAIQIVLTKEICQIKGLDTHIESVFKNILLNAKDALLNQNRTTTSNRLIEIKTEVKNQFFIAEITDNGCGISSEHLGKIYDAFFSTKPDTGMGLGLGVVKKIINLYNGSIEVKSELEKGSTFTITLPIEK